MHRSVVSSISRTLLVFALVLSPMATAAGQEGELAHLREAAHAGARDYAAQRALGIALLRAGHYREATQQLQRAAHLQARSLDALYDVARVPFAQGDHRAAETACRALARIEKAAPLTQVCNARADLVWNRSARAFEELNAALAADGSNYEALLALGDAHRLRAAVSDSESAYRRAISARASEADPHVGLGRLYAAASRRDHRAHEGVEAGIIAGAVMARPLAGDHVTRDRQATRRLAEGPQAISIAAHGPRFAQLLEMRRNGADRQPEQVNEALFIHRTTLDQRPAHSLPLLPDGIVGDVPVALVARHSAPPHLPTAAYGHRSTSRSRAISRSMYQMALRRSATASPFWPARHMYLMAFPKQNPMCSVT